MSTPDVVIFVRHSLDCKHGGKGDFFRRCDCRKHLRWTVNGKRYRRPADTRSWQEAENVKREIEGQLSGRTDETPTTKPIAEAVSLFLQDKTVQGVSRGVMSKYTLELRRFSDYCERAGAFTVTAIGRELLTGYCATWPTMYPSSCTRSKVRERVKSFLRYCYECKWLERIPALPKIKVDEAPTMPLINDEYARLLDALYVVNPRRWDGKQSTQGLTDGMRQRVHALIQVMRWSGLAIRDALSLPKSGLDWDAARQTYRVTTARQKTGTHVSVLLPPHVSEELQPLVDAHPVFVLFPDTALDFEDLAKTYTNRYIRPAFEAAGIPSDGHMVSHRLRDTFAVDLLSKGVPIDAVAKALGDTVKTTEKHYTAWIKGRQDRLDNDIAGTWGAVDVPVAAAVAVPRSVPDVPVRPTRTRRAPAQVQEHTKGRCGHCGRDILGAYRVCLQDRQRLHRKCQKAHNALAHKPTDAAVYSLSLDALLEYNASHGHKTAPAVN